MKSALTAFGAGLLFGVGLLISGMTDPRNIIGFLDFTGDWNPTLAAVMVGAIGVHATALRLLRRRETRPAAPDLAPVRQIDLPLVAGAAIFGVGWGLAGYCPGPAIVSLGFGFGPAWGFVAAMVGGVLLGEIALPSGATLLSKRKQICE